MSGFPVSGFFKSSSEWFRMFSAHYQIFDFNSVMLLESFGRSLITIAKSSAVRSRSYTSLIVFYWNDFNSKREMYRERIISKSDRIQISAKSSLEIEMSRYGIETPVGWHLY